MLNSANFLAQRISSNEVEFFFFLTDFVEIGNLGPNTVLKGGEVRDGDSGEKGKKVRQSWMTGT